jgi:nucleotide-binding universal stress UspA family protein
MTERDTRDGLNGAASSRVPDRSAAQDGPRGPRRIVAGVDGSETAWHAALWAAREAQARNVPLTLVHALHLPNAATAPLEPSGYVGRRQQAGSEFVEALAVHVRERHPGVEIEPELSAFSPTHRLVELSAPDVWVVTGTRGHGGFTGMLLGSVSRALATHAQGPLVVVRGPGPEEAQGAVVLGIGLDPADSAVEFAFEAARSYGTRLRAVRAWWPTAPDVGLGVPGSMPIGLGVPSALYLPELQITDEQAQTEAERAIERVRSRFPDVAVEVAAIEGNAVPAVCEAAADARLVVVGAHRRRGPLAVGAGYVVEGLLAHAPVPVAVIPVPESVDEP